MFECFLELSNFSARKMSFMAALTQGMPSVPQVWISDCYCFFFAIYWWGLHVKKLCLRVLLLLMYFVTHRNKFWNNSGIFFFLQRQKLTFLNTGRKYWNYYVIQVVQRERTCEGKNVHFPSIRLHCLLFPKQFSDSSLVVIRNLYQHHRIHLNTAAHFWNN